MRSLDLGAVVGRERAVGRRRGPHHRRSRERVPEVAWDGSRTRPGRGVSTQPGRGRPGRGRPGRGVNTQPRRGVLRRHREGIAQIADHGEGGDLPIRWKRTMGRLRAKGVPQVAGHQRSRRVTISSRPRCGPRPEQRIRWDGERSSSVLGRERISWGVGIIARSQEPHQEKPDEDGRR